MAASQNDEILQVTDALGNEPLSTTTTKILSSGDKEIQVEGITGWSTETKVLLTVALKNDQGEAIDTSRIKFEGWVKNKSTSQGAITFGIYKQRGTKNWQSFPVGSIVESTISADYFWYLHKHLSANQGAGLKILTNLDTTTEGIYYVQGNATTTGTKPSFAVEGFDYMVIVYKTSATSENIQQVAFQVNSNTHTNRWQSRIYLANFSRWEDWFLVNQGGTIYDRKFIDQTKVTISSVQGYAIPTGVTTYDIKDRVAGTANQTVNVFLPHENVIDGHQLLIRNRTSLTTGVKVKIVTVATNGNSVTETILFFDEDTPSFFINKDEELLLTKAGTESSGGSTFPDWKAIGVSGGDGPKGDKGDNGWTPRFAVVNRNNDRVLQVADWTGGGGSKPATGVYVTATGFDTNIANAINIRGSVGQTGATGAAGSDANVNQANVYTQNKAILKAGNNISLNKSDSNNTITITSSGGGGATSDNSRGPLLANTPDIPNPSGDGSVTDNAAVPGITWQNVKSVTASGAELRIPATRWADNVNGVWVVLVFNDNEVSEVFIPLGRTEEEVYYPLRTGANGSMKIKYDSPSDDGAYATLNLVGTGQTIYPDNSSPDDEDLIVRVYASLAGGEKGDKGDDASVNKANVYAQAKNILVAGTNVTLGIDDGAERIRINSSGGGGGSSTFTGLSDTPSSYSGKANNLIAVNSGASGLTFTTNPADAVANIQGREVATSTFRISNVISNKKSNVTNISNWTEASGIHKGIDPNDGNRQKWGERGIGKTLYFFTARDETTKARLGYLFQVIGPDDELVSEGVYVIGEDTGVNLGVHTRVSGQDRAAEIKVSADQNVQATLVADGHAMAMTVNDKTVGTDSTWAVTDAAKTFTIKVYAVELKGQKGDAGTQVAANPSGTDGSNLTRIAIAGTNYKIAGGGGTVSVVRRDVVVKTNTKAQTLTLAQQGWFSSGSALISPAWHYIDGNQSHRPKITNTDILRTSTDNRYVSQVRFTQASQEETYGGTFEISLEPNNTASGETAGNRLSDTFESQGEVTITAGNQTITIGGGFPYNSGANIEYSKNLNKAFWNTIFPKIQALNGNSSGSLAGEITLSAGTVNVADTQLLSTVWSTWKNNTIILSSPVNASRDLELTLDAPTGIKNGDFFDVEIDKVDLKLKEATGIKRKNNAIFNEDGSVIRFIYSSRDSAKTWIVENVTHEVTKKSIYTQNKAILKAGTNVTITSSNTNNELTINSSGGGGSGGEVVALGGTNNSNMQIGSTEKGGVAHLVYKTPQQMDKGTIYIINNNASIDLTETIPSGWSCRIIFRVTKTAAIGVLEGISPVTLSGNTKNTFVAGDEITLLATASNAVSVIYHNAPGSVTKGFPATPTQLGSTTDKTATSITLANHSSYNWFYIEATCVATQGARLPDLEYNDSRILKKNFIPSGINDWYRFTTGVYAFGLFNLQNNSVGFRFSDNLDNEARTISFKIYGLA